MRSIHSPALGRRRFLAITGGMAAFSMLSPAVVLAAEPVKRKGRLKQAVCRGVFSGSKLDMEGMCREATRLGALGIDLVGPADFPMLKKYGLVPTMAPGGSSIKSGINDKKNHAEIETRLREALKVAAEAKAPNVIIMAGDRAGISDQEGMENCVTFLNNVKSQAEEVGVTICMELLNSKVNHAGYMCDHTAWGAEMCKKVNSPRVKLLYDIYHMQIMEGDIIRTIRDNIKYIGHFHTAGNPGRHQFDDTQELNYRPICEAIVATGYQGYLSHEYSPTKGADPIETLDKMMAICDV